MLISLSYFSLLRKCKAIEIFILKKIESDRDGVIGRAFVFRMGVQIRAKTDISLYKMWQLRSTTGLNITGTRVERYDITKVWLLKQ